jgi:hypothetical protein
LRAYFKHAFIKQYEKFATFLRNEVCSNNLADFGLRKGLEHLAEVREKFVGVTDRFATFASVPRATELVNRLNHLHRRVFAADRHHRRRPRA